MNYTGVYYMGSEDAMQNFATQQFGGRHGPPLGWSQGDQPGSV